jgi:glutamate racemase
MNNNKPIGLFDSGIGGLSILRALEKELPLESFVYLADESNFPYGEKSKEELKQIARSNCQFLLKLGCKLIVVACNTATVNTIDSLRKKFAVPIVGIEPAVKPAAEQSEKGILILSSPKAAESRQLEQLINKYANKIDVYNVGCLALVKSIEKEKPVKPALKACLPREVLNKIDIIILGCTHFPLVKEQISEYLNNQIKIIEPSIAVAKQVKKRLEEQELLANKEKIKRRFYTTGEKRVYDNITFQEIEV